MKSWRVRAALAAIAVVFSFCAAFAPMMARAAENPQPIASVVAIDGSLSVLRAPGDKWFAGFVQMPDYVHDHLKTDDKSLAALEFKVGGKIGINKGTEIELVGPREAADVTKRGTFEKLVLKSGTVWAKFARQHEQFKIQTESTVIGIRGTEFLVETGANKETTISVLEGEVEYTGAQGAAGGPGTGAVAGPGAKITIEYQKVPVVKQYDPNALRKESEERYPALNHWFVRGVLSHAASYVPYGGLAVDIITDPNHAAQAIASAAASHVPGGGLIVGVLGSAASSKPKEPDFPNGLVPDQGEANPNNLTFNWKPFKDASEYLLLLSKDEKMDSLDWSARVKTNDAVYPKDGMPLVAGQKYYWRLIALNNEGKPKGKASQTWFAVPADYKPEGQ